jgi:hypothetical protein
MAPPYSRLKASDVHSCSLKNLGTVHICNVRGPEPAPHFPAEDPVIPRRGWQSTSMPIFWYGEAALPSDCYRLPHGGV